MSKLQTKLTAALSSNTTKFVSFMMSGTDRLIQGQVVDDGTGVGDDMFEVKLRTNTPAAGAPNASISFNGPQVAYSKNHVAQLSVSDALG